MATAITLPPSLRQTPLRGCKEPNLVIALLTTAIKAYRTTGNRTTLGYLAE
jgi:hypothetical protein